MLRLLPLVILLLVTVSSKANELVLLNKQITYKAKQIPLKKALAEIGAKYDIKFSYSESMVPVGNLITINAQSKPLSQVLDAMLHTSVTYKELNGQVVLMRKKTAGKPTLTISGYVTEKGSGELLLGVNIYVPGTSIGTTTNAYGFYSLSLPKGVYKLAYSYISYQTQIIDVDLTADKEINVALDGVKEVSAVEVVAESVVKESNKTQMSSIDIPVEQIKEIPALLGEKDVLKVIQLMPGVQKGSEGQSGFYVRGGGPDQNLIILDGAPVYNAFHLFGFFSLFNGDALKSVELIKGGFPARYGGRLSSVLDLHMKEGHKEKYSGEVGIGLISSRFTVEGPLKKNKSSFILSGRRTYIDALMQPFMTGSEKGGYYFYDLNAKINYDLGKKDKVYLSGYFGKDKFHASTDNTSSRNTFRFEWGNATATARWNHEFSNKLFGNASVIFSNYRFLVGATDEEKSSGNKFDLRFYSQIRDYSLKYDFDYYPANGHHVKMGITSTLHNFTPSAVVYKNTFIDENLNNKKNHPWF
ncbi:carboxypeptidase-like regulatory domain-containing protein [Oscillatoria amoena NRMC-F 0135]|nr:carboxypeptidase-like regulatory domain-containing protein [Oscillatoria amoena NRMC-F 0135]